MASLFLSIKKDNKSLAKSHFLDFSEIRRLQTELTKNMVLVFYRHFANAEPIFIGLFASLYGRGLPFSSLGLVQFGGSCAQVTQLMCWGGHILTCPVMGFLNNRYYTMYLSATFLDPIADFCSNLFLNHWAIANIERLCFICNY